MKKLHIHIYGVVQGVGFRPFVHTLAQRFALSGWVINDSRGVEIELTGDETTLNQFLSAVKTEFPPLAQIIRIESKISDIENSEPFTSFEIRPSTQVEGERTLISPDVAVCDDCLREMFDPSDRRYLYPFLNCTNCGPRFTIIEDLPYDRPKTTMREFPMCDDCRKEYENPNDRRFHAQPTCCPVCGPKLEFLDADGIPIDGDQVDLTISNLRKGSIIAIKGIGGFHLACDATNHDAIKTLRERKHREAKPLAVMVGSINQAKQIAEISPDVESALNSPARPIVICPLKHDADIASAEISGGLKTIGILLPYAPLHYLLFGQSGENFSALVMTSGNLSDEPIAIENSEAVNRLKGIADGFLVNNRMIYRRCDDSVTSVINNKPVVWRFGRGYAPRPIFLSRKLSPVLAVGAELKNTITLIRDDKAFLSPHIGDLDTLEAYDYFREVIFHQKKILDVSPTHVVCDLHPDYRSTRWAIEESGLPVIQVQHHWAHAVSLIAEHSELDSEIIALCMDGTGLGDDGAIWGGEILKVSAREYQRLGHFSYSPLPGGDKAVKEIWRAALGRLSGENGTLPEKFAALFNSIDRSKVDIVSNQIKTGINSPLVCSLGRLFDSAAFIAGISNENGMVQFDGQAPMLLESLCSDALILPNPNHYLETINNNFIIDGSKIISDIAAASISGREKSEISTIFHSIIVSVLVKAAQIAKEMTGINTVGLTGGCFMNRILSEMLNNHLVEKKFSVLSHRIVPTNDGGISLGQSIIGGFLGNR